MQDGIPYADQNAAAKAKAAGYAMQCLRAFRVELRHCAPDLAEQITDDMAFLLDEALEQIVFDASLDTNDCPHSINMRAEHGTWNKAQTGVRA